MLIAIDARELCGRPTGVGRYLAHLLDAWNNLPDARAHRFVLYAPSEDDELRRRTASSGVRIEVRVSPRFTGTLWEQASLASALRRDRPHVLFAPAYSAPLATSVPVVLTVHDLSFVAHPEWFPLRSRLRRRLVVGLSARRARTVITDAEFSRREVVRLLGVSPGKITVIPLGLSRVAGLQRYPAREARRPADRVVLFVGSIFNRRHVPELIRAFGVVAARHPGLRLAIVGEDRTYPRQDLHVVAREAGVAAVTTFQSYVPDESLGELYGGASAFVFLSDYEGFGLTPLEAMQAGVPVVVGDTPIAREVYGDAALFVPTTDVQAIAKELERALYDSAVVTHLRDRAPAVLARYSWENAGRATLAALVEAARD